MMETQIRFLHDLERDLVKVAALEKYKSGQGSSVVPRRRGPRRWKPWVGAAAALLTVAWGIGFLAQGGLHLATSNGSRSAAVAAPYAPSAPAVDAQSHRGELVPAATPVPGVGGYDNTYNVNQDLGASSPPAAGQATSGTSADLSKIERDASLALTIANGSFGRHYREVVAIAVANRGSLLSSETQDSGTGTLVLKIPSSNFDRALIQLRKLGHVDASSVTGRDVTAEYIDQQAHLKILRTERNVLSGLLNRIAFDKFCRHEVCRG